MVFQHISHRCIPCIHKVHVNFILFWDHRLQFRCSIFWIRMSGMKNSRGDRNCQNKNSSDVGWSLHNNGSSLEDISSWVMQNLAASEVHSNGMMKSNSMADTITVRKYMPSVTPRRNKRPFAEFRLSIHAIMPCAFDCIFVNNGGNGQEEISSEPCFCGTDSLGHGRWWNMAVFFSLRFSALVLLTYGKETHVRHQDPFFSWLDFPTWLMMQYMGWKLFLGSPICPVLIRTSLMESW